MKYPAAVTVAPTRKEGRECPCCLRSLTSVPSMCICSPRGPRCGHDRYLGYPEYSMAKKKKRPKPYRGGETNSG